MKTPWLDQAEARQAPTSVRLVRVGAVILAFEGLALLALGTAGLIVSVPGAWAAANSTAQTPVEVLGFRMNPAHSGLLMITGLLALLTLRWARWQRRFVVIQTIGYMLLYVFGLAFHVNRPTATMWDLNTADHVLHVVLFLIGLTLTLLLYAHSFDPVEGRQDTAR